MAKATKKKEPKERKPQAPKEGADQPMKKAFNSDDPEAKALFLNTHLPAIKSLKAKAATATANLRNAYKSAKAHGFDKVDFETAFQLETAEQEAKTKAKIARQMVIARFMGSDLGAQLDLFLEPDRTPAVDRAYSEGQTASMMNSPAKPTYAPETEQYRSYMKGFHDHQAKIAKKGVKPLHPEVAKDAKQTAAQKAKTAKQKKEDEKAFDGKPQEQQTSGTPLTRAEFLARQQEILDRKATDEGTESHFSKA